MQNMLNLTVLIVMLQVVGIAQSSMRPNNLPKGASMDVVDKQFSIGVAADVAQEVSQQLNGLLATEYMLYAKTQKFHWNVVGPFFGQLHKLFNDQYDELAGFLDEIAERVRALGHKSFGTLAEFVQHSKIKEDPGTNPESASMIKILLQDHETVIKHLRELIDKTGQLNEMVTNNFLCSLAEKHEKMAWMLRAHLQ